MRITATEELLSVPEVGERLGVSIYTVRRWIKSGDLPAYRPGKEYRIKSGDLEKFLEAHGPKAIAPTSHGALKPDEERRIQHWETWEAILNSLVWKWEKAIQEHDDDPHTRRARERISGVVLELLVSLRDEAFKDFDPKALSEREWEAVHRVFAVLNRLNEIAGEIESRAGATHGESDDGRHREAVIADLRKRLSA